jgi:hypothetical protein
LIAVRRAVVGLRKDKTKPKTVYIMQDYYRNTIGPCSTKKTVNVFVS